MNPVNFFSELEPPNFYKVTVGYAVVGSLAAKRIG
jgi:hypothetical protein